MSHYVILWSFETEEEEDEIEGWSLGYISGKQLDVLTKGDTVWLVYVDEFRELFLIGRLEVETVFDDEESTVAFLEEPLKYKGKEGSQYAVTKRNPPYTMRWLSISDIAHRLRFDSVNNDRLDVDDRNRVNFRQFRRRRKLSDEGIEEMLRAWERISDKRVNVDLLEDYDSSTTYREGHQIEISKRERRRNRALISEAKQRRFDEDGVLICEVCGFDFKATYGVEYIEAHHIKPLYQYDGVEKRTVDDIALLCANCHRAIHSTNPPLSIEALKQRMDQQGEHK